MEPAPVYTTIAHADVPENGRMWRYSVVLRYVAAWRDTFEPDPDFPGETGYEDHDADNVIRLYRHPADEVLRADDGYHEYVTTDLDYAEGQATEQDVTHDHWHDLFADIDTCYSWPTFNGTDLYPQRQRLIVRLLQEAGVP